MEPVWEANGQRRVQQSVRCSNLHHVDRGLLGAGIHGETHPGLLSSGVVLPEEPLL